MTDSGTADTAPHGGDPAVRLYARWRAGGPVGLDEFLAGEPGLAPADLAEVVAVDQDERWRRGDRVPAEDYFDRYPALRADTEAALRVVYGEALARIRAGEHPSLAGLQARFPWLGDPLALQWEVHEGLAAAATAAYVAAPGSHPLIEPDGYDLFEEVGRGAQGVVYRARHRKLDRVVALKLLRDAPLMQPGELVRFLEEARLAARLDHPQIVRVFDVGRHGEWPYIALEFVTGGTLAGRLAGHVIAPREAAELLAAVADAVGYAHQQGVIHRDLKPANILIGPDGRPKVTDFGLAKNTALGTGATRTGDLLGTPAYIAPEQVQAVGRVGPTADVYSLGAILYECLTGRPPLVGATVADTLLLVTRQIPVSPEAVNALVPRDLAAVCMKCLEKDPARRYLAADELAADLRRFLAGQPTHARPVGPLTRAGQWARLNPLPSALAAAAATALVTGMAVSSYFAIRAVAGERDARAAAAAADRNAAEATAAHRLAEALRGQADKARDRAEWLVYAGQVQRAHREWELEPDFGKLYDTLPVTRWDFRGPEYWLVYNAAHQGLSRLYIDTEVVRGVAFAGPGTLVCGGEDGAVGVWATATRERTHALAAGGAGVRCVSVAQDGGTVAAGGDDGFATVWNTRTREQGHRWKAHSGPVAAIAAAGGRVVTAGADGAVGVWENGRPVRQLPGPPGAVHAVAFDAAGTVLATGGADGTVRVRAVAAGAEERTFRGLSGPVLAVAVGPDGRTVAGAGADGAIRVWAADTAGRVLSGHTAAVTALAFDPAGRRLASGGRDRAARVWDLTTGVGTRLREGAGGVVTALAFSADGARVAVATDNRIVTVGGATATGAVELPVGVADHSQIAFSPDGRLVAAPTRAGTEVGVWESATGKAVRTLPGHAQRVRGVCFGDGGRRLVSCGEDGTARVWDLANPAAPPRVVAAHPGWAIAVAHHPTAPEVAVTTGDGVVKTFHAATGAPVREYRGHAGTVHAVAYSPDGARLATAGFDKTLRLWDRAAGAAGPVLTHPHPVIRVAYDPSGGRLFTTTWEGRFYAWDPDIGEALATVTGHGRTVTGIGVTPGGGRVVTASNDGTLRVWHGRSFLQLLSIGGPQPGYGPLAVSPDGGRVAAATADGRMRVWDVRAADAVRSIHPQSGGVTAVAFRPGGGDFVTLTRSGPVRVWDAASGWERLTVGGHRDEVLAAAYRPDGRQLATAGADGTIRLWDADTGAAAGTLGGRGGTVRRLAYHPGGALLAAVGADQAVTVWDVAARQPVGGDPTGGTGLDAAWSPDGRRLARATRAGVTVEEAGATRSLPGRAVGVVAWGPDGNTLYGQAADGRVVVWDVAAGAEVRSWAAAPGATAALAVSPDGRRVATGGNNRVTVWGPGTGKPEYVFPIHSGPVRGLVFSPDGRRLLSGSDDTTAKMIELADAGNLERYRR